MHDVDVIVPVLDGGDRFAACLAALQAQQGVRSRLIVVDNGSSDRSRALALGAGAVVVDEARRSSYAARNAGLTVANAPVVAFTDADCVPAPEWLRAGLDALHGLGWDLCAGQVRHEPARTVAGRHDELTYLRQDVQVRNMGFGATANLFVRRAVFDVVGPFDADLQSGGDLDFGRRARAAGFALGYEPEAVVRHQPREGLRRVLAKAWRLGVGHAQVGRHDPAIRRWGLSPRRLLPGPDVVRRSWRRPSVLVVEVLVKWTGWTARVATVTGLAGHRGRG
jgi:glycosyltransferase involved in cell wall biosynthesis